MATWTFVSHKDFNPKYEYDFLKRVYSKISNNFKTKSHRILRRIKPILKSYQVVICPKYIV